MNCPVCQMDLGVVESNALIFNFEIYHHTPDHRLIKNSGGWYLCLRNEDIFIGGRRRPTTNNEYYILFNDTEYKIGPVSIVESFNKIKSFKKLLPYL